MTHADPTPTGERRPFALDLDHDGFEALNARPGSRIAYRDLFAPHADLPRPLTRWAAERDVVLRGLSRRDRRFGGTSEKHLFGLRDGYAIESVLIRRHDGFTACISSQVGCAFGCRFCASGQAGLKRNLTPGEIVEQVVRLGRKVNRIVFMGIGEPLNNYDNVLAAIRILRDRRGMDFPTTGITLSTIGIPRGLKALREEHLGINLTISLHATTDEIRGKLIAGARKHVLADVVGGALSWARRHNRVVTFVYLLLPGINDTDADLERLVAMFRGQPARLNLMRWNEVDGLQFSRVSDHRLSAFRHGLERAGIPVVVRDTQGNRIDAACGQLWLRDLRGAPLALSA
jgi:23S rRNA (adenine2503-C2)-methyltransferase